MRDFLIFLVVLAVIFFGIGEWQGWYVGIASQTPMVVYKKDFTAVATRRTLNRDDIPFTVKGRVREGVVRVEGYFERPESFQTSRAAEPERILFEEEFTKGQQINVNEILEQGRGVYRVRIIFVGATGIFRLSLPKGSEL